MERPDVFGVYIIAVTPGSTHSASYHHGDLRRALLQAARALLQEDGADAVSLRELARRAGVSPRAPYRHFASKDALMAALATEGFEGLRAELTAAGDGAPEGRALDAQAQAYVRFALNNPPMFRLMFSYRMENADGELLAAKQATKAQLAACVAADARSGEDMPARALGCWSLVHGLAILILDGLALEDLPLDQDVITERVIGAMI